MAALRSKAQLPVGSMQWILDERDQAARFGDQEAEDFAFSARNEVDWLNEHMAEIFSNNQLNVTEIFKTPGKLRGKTPRTARKRNPLEARAPLTDVFSANARSKDSPSHATKFYKEVKQLRTGKDVTRSPLVPKRGKENFDSGYHGLPEDDMDIDQGVEAQRLVSVADPLQQEGLASPPNVSLNLQAQDQSASQDRRTTEGSFHSAKEDLTSRDVNKPRTPQPESTTTFPHDEAYPNIKAPAFESTTRVSPPRQHSPKQHANAELVVTQIEQESVLEDPDVDSSHSPSEKSSPVRPLLRKSSLTFAALPARPPLTTTKNAAARVSRTSHLEQTRNSALSRGSLLGRYTGGKSLGGIRQPDDANENDEGDEMDLAEEERPRLDREDSDPDGKMAILHNKSSTQRLHERITMLGKTQPARPTKSITAAVPVTVQPSYPNLPRPSGEDLHAPEQAPTRSPKQKPDAMIDDDDDWINPPSTHHNDAKRPYLLKSHSADVMEQISGKDSIGGREFELDSSERGAVRQPSPLRHLVIPDRPPNGVGHMKSASTTELVSPPKVSSPKEPSHKKAISVSNPTVPMVGEVQRLIESETPAGTPARKYHGDGPLSASKSKLQSIMKTARGLFTSSAGVSAQAKMETLSPASMLLRSQVQGPSTNDASSIKSYAPSTGGSLYPSLPNGGMASIPQEGRAASPLRKVEGRTTRNSTEKRREKEAKERQRADIELEKLREKERQRAAKAKAQQDKLAAAETPQPMEIDEPILPNPTKPVRQSPRRAQNQVEAQLAKQDAEVPLDAPERVASVEQMPPPQLPKQPQAPRAKDPRRPVKPAKEVAPKPRPQPVAIRVGTFQRIPLTNTALSSGLQESLPPNQLKQAGPVRKASTASLQTSASNSSLKSSVSSVATKPKALLAAERKREQDEKEAQRKLEHKREIERKRAAQQEEAHRKEQQQRQEIDRQRERERTTAAEDPRKVAQKQAIEKRRLELGKKEQQRNQRPANDLAHAMQQDQAQGPAALHRGDLGGGRPPSRLNAGHDQEKSTMNRPAPNPARPPIKRVFDPDGEDEPTRVGHVQQGQTFRQVEAKRRRTEEEEFVEAPIRPTMAPPLRPSNIHRDAPKSTLMSNGYAADPSTISGHPSASLRQPAPFSQPPHPHLQKNHVSRPGDTAKYAKGPIPFAEAPNPPAAPSSSFQTPHPPKPPSRAPKSSPAFPNGDNIQLEEIHTSDEDEDSPDNNKSKKKSNLADWAQQENLDRLLVGQEGFDADGLFGPIQPLVMEEIFKDKSRHHRYRPRTSSANWGGSDRLTEEEIREDVRGRERLRREGGWTYGL